MFNCKVYRNWYYEGDYKLLYIDTYCNITHLLCGERSLTEGRYKTIWSNSIILTSFECWSTIIDMSKRSNYNKTKYIFLSSKVPPSSITNRTKHFLNYFLIWFQQLTRWLRLCFATRIVTGWSGYYRSILIVLYSEQCYWFIWPLYTLYRMPASLIPSRGDGLKK